MHIGLSVHIYHIYLLDLFRWYWDGDISDWAGLLLSRASPHFWFPSNTNRGMWELSTWLAALYTTWKFLSVQHSLNGTVSHSLPNASFICDDDNEWANVPSADYSIFWNFFRHESAKGFIINTFILNNERITFFLIVFDTFYYVNEKDREAEGCVIDWLLAPAKGHLQIDHVKIIIDFNSEFKFPEFTKNKKKWIEIISQRRKIKWFVN